MKMRPEHYKQLLQAVQRVQWLYPKITVQSYLAQGLTAMRFRWDVLFATTRLGYFDFDGCALYDYLNDSHIDMALRRITGTT